MITELVATWATHAEFRFVRDKFGLGTPRVLLELPKFSSWKRAVYAAANEIALTQEDLTRLAELFKLFDEHRCRRVDAVYDRVVSWLENAEAEFDRRPFAGIVATENPRAHRAVLIGDQLGAVSGPWTCELGATPSRTPTDLAKALAAMLTNCRELHLVDPHFGAENARHRRVIEALVGVVASRGTSIDVIRVHCSDKAELGFFETAVAEMASRLPTGITIDFVRRRPRSGGEKLHNRYVLTDLGGVSLGIGLDAGDAGQTDDVLLLPRAQYERRWSQYVIDDGSFEPGDTPASVRGTRPPPSSKGRR